jgi:saccharopine dehydrogenase-like NADP-dependent oxidoreductase
MQSILVSTADLQAAFDAGCSIPDMAMTLSEPHPERPYGSRRELGDAQFEVDERWRDAGRLALVGIGVEPGLPTSSPRHAR